MAMTTCTGLGCSGGYVRSFRGGQFTFETCPRCGGTGKVFQEGSAPAESTRCPYDACGDRCRGKGYYEYAGGTIYCRRR
jgi:hypothetical protein